MILATNKIHIGLCLRDYSCHGERALSIVPNVSGSRVLLGYRPVLNGYIFRCKTPGNL